MITSKRDLWYMSVDCKVNDIISYIESQGQMRDACICQVKKGPLIS